MDAIETQIREYFGDKGTQEVLAAIKAKDAKLLRKAARAWANKAWVLPLLFREQIPAMAKRMEDRATLLRKLASDIEAGDLC